MPLLTQIRENIETDLPDDALSRLVSDAVTEVESRFGTDAEMTVTLECDGHGVRLMRPALSVTSVVELDTLHVVQQTFAPADFVLMHGGRTLRRLGGYSWPGLITVVYLPVPEVDIRDRVIIDLVRLALTYNGQVHQESIGDYSAGGSVTADTYQRERENLLAGISNRRGFRFA